MLLITCGLDEISVSSKKEVGGAAYYKFRGCGIVFKNARIILASDSGRDIYLKPARNCDNIKRYLAFERRLGTLMGRNDLNSIQFHKDHGHVIRCRLRTALSGLDNGNLYNGELRIVYCKTTERRSCLVWNVASVEEAPVEDVLDTPPDSEEDDDDDDEPPPEEVEAERRSVVDKLEAEVMRLTPQLEALGKRIKALNGFLHQLNMPPETQPLLETVIKANMALDSDP